MLGKKIVMKKSVHNMEVEDMKIAFLTQMKKRKTKELLQVLILKETCTAVTYCH